MRSDTHPDTCVATHVQNRAPTFLGLLAGDAGVHASGVNSSSTKFSGDSSCDTICDPSEIRWPKRCDAKLTW